MNVERKTRADSPGAGIAAASPASAPELAALIYESSHELMNFIFGGHDTAIGVLAKLVRGRRGHFSHRFARVVTGDRKILALVLGYDKTELAREELAGGVLMLVSAPVSKWWHIATTVNSTVSRYVPAPSENAFYINNLAVRSDQRGKGHGQRLIRLLQESMAGRYKMIELDVTENNRNAIGFYEKTGFKAVSRSAPPNGNHELPPLIRMQLAL